MLTVAGKKTAARKEREIQTDRQTERVGERGRGREREGEGWRERERSQNICTTHYEPYRLLVPYLP